MKPFDPFKWHKAKPNEKLFMRQGSVHGFCSDPNAVWLVETANPETGELRDAIAAVGPECHAKTAGACTLTVIAVKGALLYVEHPLREGIKPSGQKYTNTDRKPQESGAVLEVRKALREFEYAKRQGLRELRAATRAASQPKPAKDEGTAEPAKPETKAEPKPQQEGDANATA